MAEKQQAAVAGTRVRVPIPGNPGYFQRGSKVTFQYQDPTGRRRWGTAKNLKAAKVLRSSLVTAVDEGTWQAPSKVTFAAYAEEWVASYTGRTSRGIRAITLAEYKVRLNKHAVPYFGQRRLVSIDPPAIREFVKHLQGLGQSPNTVRNYVAPVRRLFATAHADGVVRSNPCAGLLLATGEGMKVKFLTREQLDGLLANAPGPFAHLLILFAANTGLRISEICGLTWADVELSGGLVHVRQRRRGADVDAPKSAASTRTVPLAPNLATALKEHKLASKFSAPEDPVFATRAGSPIKPGNAARQYLKPAAVAAKIPVDLARWHVLRHTFASVLLEAESKGLLTVRQAADVLGHSDPAFFLRVYAHSRELPDLSFLTTAIGGGPKKSAAS